jgi:luciferase-like monooxygenase
MSVSGAGQKIQSELSHWEGIASAPHRFGGVEFRLGTREIGHVHGDSLVDVPLPKRVRNELVASGQAEPHHVLPNSGWVSLYLNEPADVDRVIGVLRLSFEIAREQRERRSVQNREFADASER